SMASLIAIRHIDRTFAELERLRHVGDLAEEIEQRVTELRLAGHDFITDPAAQSNRVAQAASELSALLKQTRLELAPRQQAMIDGVTRRLADYRKGIEQVSALISRRAKMLAALPPVRARFEQALADAPDRSTALSLFRAHNEITAALLANELAGARQSALRMRSVPIDNPMLRKAVDDYAEAIMSIAGTDSEISRLDKDVLRTDGRSIGRVTELLREASARQGRVLSHGLARTLLAAKWQSIILSTIAVLIGMFAASFVVRHTVRPLASIAGSIRAVAAGNKDASIPDIDVENEICDIARAAEVFRRTLVEADAAREAAVRALTEQRLAEESYRKLFETSVDGIYVTTPAGALLNANPALARMMGYETPQQLIENVSDIARVVYVHPAARDEFQHLMQRDGV
ncbi:MAG: PAS domain S-box protein, partial [Bradyrhizobium sp.]